MGVVGKWRGVAEQIRSNDNGTFCALSAVGTDSGQYVSRGRRLRSVPGGMPELEAVREFRVSRSHRTLRLCEVDHPNRCNEFDSMKQAAR